MILLLKEIDDILIFHLTEEFSVNITWMHQYTYKSVMMDSRDERETDGFSQYNVNVSIYV